jgi:RNA polymerase sigma-70 factor (ECF subfamily)
VLGEKALFDRLKDGEPQAFEELVREFGGRMRATAVRLLMDEAEADDAVQDAFLSAFRNLATFEGRASLGTWLHRITINAALMRLRSRGRRKETELDGLLPRFTENGVFQTSQTPLHESADEPAQRDELRRRVRGHIAELPETHRVALCLRDLEGLPHKEVAQILDISENAAKLRVHRARQALRALLEPLVEESA